jgi:hypothetical protein
MKNNSEKTGVIFSELIIYHLDKILRSPGFKKSRTLSQFLLYVVDETMKGRSNSIKEYTIATGALNKPVNFSPMTDCIVRVHANRLRDELDNYYQKAGQQDELIISIPKGRYIPVFAVLPGYDIDLRTIYNPKTQTTYSNQIEMKVISFKTNDHQIPRVVFEGLSDKNNRRVI